MIHAGIVCLCNENKLYDTFKKVLVSRAYIGLKDLLFFGIY